MVSNIEKLNQEINKWEKVRAESEAQINRGHWDAEVERRLSRATYQIGYLKEGKQYLQQGFDYGQVSGWASKSAFARMNYATPIPGTQYFQKLQKEFQKDTGRQATPSEITQIERKGYVELPQKQQIQKQQPTQKTQQEPLRGASLLASMFDAGHRQGEILRGGGTGSEAMSRAVNVGQMQEIQRQSQAQQFPFTSSSFFVPGQVAMAQAVDVGQFQGEQYAKKTGVQDVKLSDVFKEKRYLDSKTGKEIQTNKGLFNYIPSDAIEVVDKHPNYNVADWLESKASQAGRGVDSFFMRYTPLPHKAKRWVTEPRMDFSFTGLGKMSFFTPAMLTTTESFSLLGRHGLKPTQETKFISEVSKDKKTIDTFSKSVIGDVDEVYGYSTAAIKQGDKGTITGGKGLLFQQADDVTEITQFSLLGASKDIGKAKTTTGFMDDLIRVSDDLGSGFQSKAVVQTYGKWNLDDASNLIFKSADKKITETSMFGVSKVSAADDTLTFVKATTSKPGTRISKTGISKIIPKENFDIFGIIRQPTSAGKSAAGSGTTQQATQQVQNLIVPVLAETTKRTGKMTSPVSGLITPFAGAKPQKTQQTKQQQNIQNIIMPIVEEKQTTPTIVRQKLETKTRQKVKPVVSPVSLIAPTAMPAQKPRIRQMQQPVQIQKTAVQLAQPQIQTPKAINPFIPNAPVNHFPTKPNIPIIPPGFDFRLGGGSRKARGSGKTKKRQFTYSPTLASIFTGFTTKKTPSKTSYTGFEVFRPVPERKYKSIFNGNATII